MSDADGVRIIDSGAPPERFARGWHCLGLAADFRAPGGSSRETLSESAPDKSAERSGVVSEPHAIHAFGTKLVVFADSAGKLNVLDAYCRHMGGDLSMGTVKDDSVACPFHDWRWGGNGKCTGIPYGRRIPPTARTRAWTTLERNGQLFVWNDPQGNPPRPEEDIPEIAGVGSDEWSTWTWDSLLVEGSNCREIIDNVVDMAHFFYIHYAFPTYFKNVFEGHVATQYLRTKARPDVGAGSNYSQGGVESVLHSEASYFGPSYMINDLHHEMGDFSIDSVLINCHYPVTPTSFKLQWGMMIKKPEGLTGEHAEKFAAKFAKFIGVGFLQDVEIWKHKARIDNPLLCAEDGPVYQLRRWYDQFYTDVENIDPEMTDRYEFEIDTARAVAAWEEEVKDNLAQRQAEKEAAEQAADARQTEARQTEAGEAKAGQAG
ncbi:MAG TPA: Rieske 2Fe-2S domain-containing protein [Trebonia sp.]|jgi:3-ketosteroid 9alpha-monooxygenase subunit A